MSSTAITMPTPPLFDEARLAVAGFLARYSGPTRKSYVSDLRQFFAWCASVDLEVFATKRPHRAVGPLHGGEGSGPGHHRAEAIDGGRLLPDLRAQQPYTDGLRPTRRAARPRESQPDTGLGSSVVLRQLRSFGEWHGRLSSGLRSGENP